ncbi:succinate-semialdehyde dehydrogenase / glutarate-semialdehyde dehydrogenase [Gemmobacter aquatilis]|uniref:Succinate-semialdehyde dehydrogenase / glutarate-semialdehyde dehydrogenase n=1 Tax=Gemmobacter aquatilis TaxID=933059 RepID=A0A1H8ME06_9RHOB|nr:NAD-dependent succinate-semialdehyde dehydrogenase [Gemmobacter aquatilis]SEO15601.1 succinate-semialdehyde dehydrogenase / glutarate-semialdehyde dehydrogenase [Gemmobacter aquatilis]
MALAEYPRIEIIIGGKRIGPEGRVTRPVINPATGAELGTMPAITPAELEQAVQVSQAAFNGWKDRAALDRSAILRRFADLLRRDEAQIARDITLDMGKPLAEALAEVRSAADYVDWHAEEGRRVYGRIIPARIAGVQQLVTREPVGVCLAIAPWNFPLSQSIRKVANALAAGCSLLLKGATETPSAIMAIANRLEEAGLPDGVLNILWGDSALIADTLLAHPLVKKISFTGSVPVGKHLAALAGRHMKRATMELGGHAPVLVFDDVDAEAVARALTANKLRNAGQVCISPTRFYVQDGAYDRFLPALVAAFEKITVGNGLDAATQMGPLCHPGRVAAMETLVADARENGAHVATGGKRLGNEGYFYAPTIVETPDDRIALMNEEPFGPIAVVSRFKADEDGLRRANGLPFGLASYVFTNSLKRADRAAAGLQAGMVSINHFGLALAETPFGGINDSGYGSEGGMESFEGYLNTKFVSRMSNPVV